MSDLAQEYRDVGGVPYFTQGGPVKGGETESAWAFGYIPECDRTPSQQILDHAAKNEMPEFRIIGKEDDPKKACLWEASLIVNNGKHFEVFKQSTGSCVGNGGGQAVWYLSAVEVVRLKDTEQVLLPFYLLPYGRSRMYAGLRGRGDGSFGSAFAKAIKVDGILSADDEGLPKYQSGDGISWGSSTELQWSDGEAISQTWLEKSRKHIVKTTAQCRDADQVRDAIRNYYPVTIASDWGGQMRVGPSGTPEVLLNRRVTTWMHQMCVIGWWDHPTHGEIFCVLNSWGPNAHGKPPDDSPPGSFWVKKADMEYIARQGDTFAFSQFDGFPSQTLTWYI
jgi:hypothetical protein